MTGRTNSLSQAGHDTDDRLDYFRFLVATLRSACSMGLPSGGQTSSTREYRKSLEKLAQIIM